MRYFSASVKHSRGFHFAAVALMLSLTLEAGEIVDRLAAVVNGEIITNSEVMTAFHLQEKQVKVPDQQEWKAVLDQLINRELAYQEIIRFEQVQVKKEEVRLAVEDYKKSLPAGYFQEIMAANGVTEEELEVIFSKKIIIEKFCNERFLPFIQISPDEIEAYYKDVLLPEFQRKGEKDQPSLEMVSGRIRQQLREDKFTRSVQEWIEKLKLRSKIIILLSF